MLLASLFLLFATKLFFVSSLFHCFLILYFSYVHMEFGEKPEEGTGWDEEVCHLLFV